jgi:mannose/fructose/N-acetylgalactosamine-specific phosphotransferase system component IID
MEIEQLKLIVELLKGVTNGALAGAILYLVLPVIQAVIKWGLMTFVILKIGKLISDFQTKKIEKINKLADEVIIVANEK